MFGASAADSPTKRKAVPLALDRITLSVVQRHILPLLTPREIVMSLIRVNRAYAQLICVTCDNGLWREWLYQTFSEYERNAWFGTADSKTAKLPPDLKTAISLSTKSQSSSGGGGGGGGGKSGGSSEEVYSSREWVRELGGCGGGQIVVGAGDASFWYRCYYHLYRVRQITYQRRRRPKYEMKANSEYDYLFKVMLLG